MQSATDPGATPPDIILETLISVVLLAIGYVLRSPPLKPIVWSKWAGELERSGAPHVFQGLEQRIGFVDIRAKRREFAHWVRAQGQGTEKE